MGHLVCVEDYLDDDQSDRCNNSLRPVSATRATNEVQEETAKEVS